MKHLISSISKAGILIFSGLLLFGLTGCDFSGFNQAVDNFGVVIKLDSIHTSSTVLVKDAKSNELITNKVDATFQGPHGDQVIDIYSDPLSEKTVESGILTFGISNSVNPSEDSPAEVTLQLSADGYVSTNRTVTIESEGSNKFSVEMIRKSDPPSGVEMKSNTEGQADQDGSVQQSYSVEVTSETSSSSSATTQANNTEYGFEMEITKGTVFKDREGNPLTGQLTTDVTYYNPMDVEAMKSIPMDMKTADGSRVLTYGMVGMEITGEKGKVAASVSSGSPKVTMKNGSSLPEVQGYLKNAQVCIDADFNSQCSDAKAMTPTRNNKGKFELASVKSQFENAPTLVHSGPSSTDPNDNSPSAKPHLNLKAPNDANVVTPLTTLVQREAEQQMGQNNPSSNLPDIVAAAKQKVKEQLEIKKPQSDIDELKTDIEVSAPGYHQSAGIKIGQDANKQIKTLKGLPRGDVNYTLEFPQMNKKMKGTHNFSKDGKLGVTAPEPPSNLIEATVEVALACESPDKKVAVTDIPSASVLYRKANAEPGTDWLTASNLEWDYDEDNQELTGGSFEASGVEQGVVYTFKITYESTTHERDITIDGKNVSYEETVSGSVCS